MTPPNDFKAKVANRSCCSTNIRPGSLFPPEGFAIYPATGRAIKDRSSSAPLRKPALAASQILCKPEIPQEERNRPDRDAWAIPGNASAIMSVEHAIQNAIRNALAGRAMIFRANVGKGWTGKADRVTAPGTVAVQPGDVIVRQARVFDTGLPPGFSDLFGLVPVTITPDMVGQTIAQFVAPEVKSPTGRATDQQLKFHSAVNRMGGRSGIVRSPSDAFKLLGIEP